MGSRDSSSLDFALRVESAEHEISMRVSGRVALSIGNARETFFCKGTVYGTK